jgi:hypothetical protein
MLLDDDTSLARNFQKQFREKKATNYSSKAVMKKYYRNMLERVKTIPYKKKRIVVEISLEDFEKFWEDNQELMHRIQEAGFVVSVDRINSFGNYSRENIRILPLHLNTALGRMEMYQEQLKQIYKLLENSKEWLL